MIAGAKYTASSPSAVVTDSNALLCTGQRPVQAPSRIQQLSGPTPCVSSRKENLALIHKAANGSNVKIRLVHARRESTTPFDTEWRTLTQAELDLDLDERSISQALERLDKLDYQWNSGDKENVDLDVDSFEAEWEILSSNLEVITLAENLGNETPLYVDLSFVVTLLGFAFIFSLASVAEAQRVVTM
jgi:hypothetical protein